MFTRDPSGPYDSGQWRDDAMGCYLEWCRIMNARLRIVRALYGRAA